MRSRRAAALPGSVARAAALRVARRSSERDDHVGAAAADLRGRGSQTSAEEDEPIEVVMASAKPKPDFDR
jgi:hypothetical protein